MDLDVTNDLDEGSDKMVIHFKIRQLSYQSGLMKSLKKDKTAIKELVVVCRFLRAVWRLMLTFE